MGILDSPDRWTIEWSESPFTGKHVTLANGTTGQRCTGHDWANWDRALRRALDGLEAEGDLISEIERHLSNR